MRYYWTIPRIRNGHIISQCSPISHTIIQHPIFPIQIYPHSFPCYIPFFHRFCSLGVSEKLGYPNSWMVYKGKSYCIKWMVWGTPLLGNLHLV